LDEFCDAYKSTFQFTDDWRLLKAFNRVFWLRYLISLQPESDKKNADLYRSKYQCPNRECCPFGDPTKSETMYVQPVEEEKEPLSYQDDEPYPSKDEV